MTRNTAVLLAVMLLSPGCTSPKERIEQSARTARSWEATARSTSKALSYGSAPRVYGEQILTAATENERQLARQPEWQRVAPSVRRRLEVAIQELASALEMSDSAPRP